VFKDDDVKILKLILKKDGDVEEMKEVGTPKTLNSICL